MIWKKYNKDIFICHATEDKIDVANRFDTTLKELGLDVWYDKDSIFVGEYFLKEIKKGLEESMLVVAIISDTSSEKDVPSWEIGGVIFGNHNVPDRLIPVFYKISVANKSKFKKYFQNTQHIDIDEDNQIAEAVIQINKRVQITKERIKKEKNRWRIKFCYFLVLAVVGIFSIGRYFHFNASKVDSNKTIKQEIPSAVAINSDFKILILPFDYLDSVTNKKIQIRIEKNLEKKLLETSRKLNLKFYAKFEKSLQPASSFTEARTIGKKLGYNMVIYGDKNDKNDSTDVSLEYVMVNKFTPGILIGRQTILNSSEIMEQGKLMEDIDFVIYSIFGFEAFNKKNYSKALTYFRHIDNSVYKNGDLYFRIGVCYISKSFGEASNDNREQTLDSAHSYLNYAIKLKTAYIAETYDAIGFLYSQKNEREQAISNYSIAILLKPDYAQAYCDRGLEYNYQKKYNKAIADYSSAIFFKSDDADAYFNRGLIYDLIQKTDSAISDFSNAIKFKPDYAEAYRNRGLSYESIKKSDEAFADFSKAIDLKPGYAAAYCDRGCEYDSQKKYYEAIADYSTAIYLKPNDAITYLDRGLTYDNLKNSDKAMEDYTKVIDLKSDLASKAYNNRGVIYSNKKESDNAITDFTEAIKLNPDYFEAYINRGKEYNSNNKYDKAMADFNKAIELKKDFAESYYYRGYLYCIKKVYGKAILDYNKAIELKNDYADVYLNRGIVYYYKKEYDKAIADFDKAIQYKPDFAEAYNIRGILYCEENKYDKALADFDKAILYKPDFTEAYKSRGMVFSEKNRYDKALKNFNKAIQHKPNFTETYGNRKVLFQKWQ